MNAQRDNAPSHRINDDPKDVAMCRSDLAVGISDSSNSRRIVYIPTFWTWATLIQFGPSKIAKGKEGPT